MMKVQHLMDNEGDAIDNDKIIETTTKLLKPRCQEPTRNERLVAWLMDNFNKFEVIADTSSKSDLSSLG